MEQHTGGSALTAYRGRWLAAIVMIGAATMDLIDVTIVNVALPTIRRDLGASGAQLEWIVSAYMLARSGADRGRQFRRPTRSQAHLRRRHRRLRAREPRRRRRP